jgi:hypothetical protein
METTAENYSGIGAAATVRRSISELLQPLEDIASRSPNLVANHDASFEVRGEKYVLPRYLFVGPRGGDTPVRLGIFAGVRGNDLEGIHALILFIRLLEAKPDLAAGYCLFLYPTCNPSGYVHETDDTHNGKDLNREFWQGSREPEVLLLQSEILSHAFSGMISLYSNDTKDHFGAVGRDGIIQKHLIDPALRAVQKFSEHYDPPIFRSPEEFTAVERSGRLSAPPDLRPKPFEIILETAETRAAWLVVAFLNILDEYRKLIAYAPNL